MKQDTKHPLYKVLNEERTGDKIGVDYDHCKAPLSLCSGNFDTGDNWAHIASAWKEADAKYMCLAFNNLHLLAEALATIKNVLTDWNGEGKYQNLIEHAKTALNRIS